MYKKLLRTLALAMVLCFVGTSALATPPQFLVNHGDREQRRIAITVDDCYDINVLQMMHDLSVEQEIPLTVFLLGKMCEEKDAELWLAIVDHGSELGNHTWNHNYLTRINAHAARNYILLTQERVDQVLGYHYPLRLLRPPFGKYNENGVNRLPLFDEYGVEKVILWDVSQTDPELARKETQNGSILLFHTNYKDLHCLEKLIPWLKEDGYEFCTVSELLGMDPVETSDELYVFPYR